MAVAKHNNNTPNEPQNGIRGVRVLGQKEFSPHQKTYSKQQTISEKHEEQHRNKTDVLTQKNVSNAQEKQGGMVAKNDSSYNYYDLNPDKGVHTNFEKKQSVSARSKKRTSKKSDTASQTRYNTRSTKKFVLNALSSTELQQKKSTTQLLRKSRLLAWLLSFTFNMWLWTVLPLALLSVLFFGASVTDADLISGVFGNFAGLFSWFYDISDILRTVGLIFWLIGAAMSIILFVLSFFVLFVSGTNPFRSILSVFEATLVLVFSMVPVVNLLPWIDMWIVRNLFSTVSTVLKKG